MAIIFRCETPPGAITSLACAPGGMHAGKPGEIPDLVGTEGIADTECPRPDGA
jgi:hypothetical protein